MGLDGLCNALVFFWGIIFTILESEFTYSGQQDGLGFCSDYSLSYDLDQFQPLGGRINLWRRVKAIRFFLHGDGNALQRVQLFELDGRRDGGELV